MYKCGHRGVDVKWPSAAGSWVHGPPDFWNQRKHGPPQQCRKEKKGKKVNTINPQSKYLEIAPQLAPKSQTISTYIQLFKHAANMEGKPTKKTTKKKTNGVHLIQYVQGKLSWGQIDLIHPRFQI